MIHWYNGFALIIILILLNFTFKDHSDGGSSYGDISILVNVFWCLILLLFLAIWGGIFWW